MSFPQKQLFTVVVPAHRDQRTVKRLLNVVGKNARTIASDSMPQSVNTLVKKHAEYAVIPLENTQQGTLHASFDLLTKHKLMLCGEIYSNQSDHYIRYGVVHHAPRKHKPLTGNKVSLLLTLPHVPGSLSRFLVQCAGRGMNLTKVESRPILGKPNAYMFYVDFIHSFEPSVLERVLKALEVEAMTFTLLGAYQADTLGPYEIS